MFTIDYSLTIYISSVEERRDYRLSIMRVAVFGVQKVGTRPSLSSQIGLYVYSMMSNRSTTATVKIAK